MKHFLLCTGCWGVLITSGYILQIEDLNDALVGVMVLLMFSSGAIVWHISETGKAFLMGLLVIVVVLVIPSRSKK